MFQTESTGGRGGVAASRKCVCMTGARTASDFFIQHNLSKTSRVSERSGGRYIYYLGQPSRLHLLNIFVAPGRLILPKIKPGEVTELHVVSKDNWFLGKPKL